MIEVASYTDIGGRNQNEDFVRYVFHGEDHLCLVLADGLGGHGGGSQASRLAANTICDDWDGVVDCSSLSERIQTANERVLSIQTEQCSMKTTVTVLTLEPGRAVWGHAGDTRLYHFLNGKLVFQTRDHSAAQIGVMLGQITPRQIRFHPDRNRVLRALGQEEELSVETQAQPLSPGKHAFLLCSDGFWEYVLEEEMAMDLAESYDPNDWLSRMRTRLLSKIPENSDNNTAAAVWIDENI